MGSRLLVVPPPPSLRILVYLVGMTHTFFIGRLIILQYLRRIEPEIVQEQRARRFKRKHFYAPWPEGILVYGFETTLIRSLDSILES